MSVRAYARSTLTKVEEGFSKFDPGFGDSRVAEVAKAQAKQKLEGGLDQLRQLQLPRLTAGGAAAIGGLLGVLTVVLAHLWADNDGGVQGGVQVALAVGAANAVVAWLVRQTNGQLVEPRLGAAVLLVAALITLAGRNFAPAPLLTFFGIMALACGLLWVQTRAVAWELHGRWRVGRESYSHAAYGLSAVWAACAVAGLASAWGTVPGYTFAATAGASAALWAARGYGEQVVRGITASCRGCAGLSECVSALEKNQSSGGGGGGGGGSNSKVSNVKGITGRGEGGSGEVIPLIPSGSVGLNLSRGVNFEDANAASLTEEESTLLQEKFPVLYKSVQKLDAGTPIDERRATLRTLASVRNSLKTSELFKQAAPAEQLPQWQIITNRLQGQNMREIPVARPTGNQEAMRA